jgi:transcriptional regulator with XRE-family HTH domain
MTNYLGSFIKQKRGNMSLREFANLIGISHSHLDSIEKGIDPKTGKPVNLSLEVLNKLAKVLDVEDLLLIYLAKIDYKESPNYFNTLTQFQTQYKDFYKKYHFDKNDNKITFDSKKTETEWNEIKKEIDSELKKIGKNDLMLLLYKNLSIDDIIELIKNNIDDSNCIDKDTFTKMFNSAFNIKSNEPIKKDDLEILFDKHKDVLTESDKEKIKAIFEQRKKEIDKELDGE